MSLAAWTVAEGAFVGIVQIQQCSNTERSLELDRTIFRHMAVIREVNLIVAQIVLQENLRHAERATQIVFDKIQNQ